MMSSIKIQNLRKEYSNKVQALKGIDLEIQEGDFHALLGSNGAGKTTTIGILTDLVKKTSGTVEIAGIDIEKNFNQAKKLIGVVPQEMNFNIFEKVEDIVIQQAGFYGLNKKQATEKTHEILKSLSLYDKKEQISRTLSGGMKRRLMIARSLVHDPKILILDEPTAGVDVKLRHEMYEFLTDLNKKGVTILLTTHYLEEAELLCDKISIIKEGEIIISGKKEKVLNDLSTQIYLFESQNFKPQSLKNYKLSKTENKNEFQVQINKNQSLNQFLKESLAENFTFESIKPKTNRLEQLYLELT
ncbi:ABC transporter ATP-binding protein [bacterium]|nr:ABC transporter ATP-binding protein [bacterium]MBT6293804.1 ABC transporter ATP-binding protein [bacterium]